MKILYFASVKELIGKGEENLDAIPSSVQTIGELMDFLSTLGDEYTNVFSQKDVVHAAVNQEHVSLDHPIKGAYEIAFFPPMTGG